MLVDPGGINQLSLRQAITPERLMGRMNAVVRFMYWGAMPAGAVAGEALAADEDVVVVAALPADA